MSDSEPPPAEAAASGARTGRVSLVGLAGEIFLTAGVVVLLFIGWQVWLNDILVGAEQTRAASELAAEWEEPEVPQPTASPSPVSPAPPVPPADPGEPVVLAKPKDKESFANLIIPRLGADYRRSVAQGVGQSVLSNRSAGVGHYPQTQMPGEVGNFALAAHRTTYGAPFHDVNKLVVGDSIFVETQDGWYKYVYRSTEYVRPTGVGVLNPVPQAEGAASDRIITLTSCHPLFSAAERIISYGVFETWYPRAGGAPAEISAVSQAGGE